MAGLEPAPRHQRRSTFLVVHGLATTKYEQGEGSFRSFCLLSPQGRRMSWVGV